MKTIKGRVPVVVPCMGGYLIKSGHDYLNNDGQWSHWSYDMPNWWHPTEAAAREFAIEVAKREADHISDAGKMVEGFIVELQPGCWLGDWSGDPGRTLVRPNAKVFPSYMHADAARCEARVYRPFPDAKIVPVNLPDPLTATPTPEVAPCQCTTCMEQREPGSSRRRMVVCSICGNKRCPHATFHEYDCTNSNEPGQWPTKGGAVGVTLTPEAVAKAERVMGGHEGRAVDVEGCAGDERTHDLKTWPEYFEKILDGSKRFELRNNDRDFRVGDVLLLREWRPTDHKYTGRTIRVRVTYLTDNTNWLNGHSVAMSINLLAFDKAVTP